MHEDPFGIRDPEDDDIGRPVPWWQLFAALVAIVSVISAFWLLLQALVL